VGGPLDGDQLDADAVRLTEDQVRGGTYEVVPGWVLRAAYGPRPGEDPYVWHYEGPALV
jgi:hypothetical protein